MRAVFATVLSVLLWNIESRAAATEPPNILFIAIDDQNDWLGCMEGHQQAHTPNIDALARRGMIFTNAHCQAPLCNPSRTSLLTGLRPSTTGIHGLQPGLRDVERTKDLVTLPQTFTRAGWHSVTTGKIFHDGSLKPDQRVSEFTRWMNIPGQPKPGKRFANLPGTPHPLMDWGPFPESEAETTDFMIATNTIQALAEAPTGKPFFIACGFRLPHVPLFAPQKYFDLFPEETLVMPPVKIDDRADTPRFSWYLHWKLPEPRLATLERTGEWRPHVRAYLAGTALMDAQVGRVIDALEKSGRAEETIIVLWSDNGYHLGEKAISGKNSLWERSTRVPLIFAGPGIQKNAKCHRPAELLDIFPTLLELASQEPRADLEGRSLVPQLRNPSAPREHPAITTASQGNHAVRSENFRYIRYADGSEELYDMAADPNEWNNLASDPKHEATKSELKKWLPTIDVASAPGSRSRVLTFNPATGAVSWEGTAISASDAIPMDN